MSTLKLVAKIALGSSAAGFGGQGGKTFYRNFEKNWQIWLLIALTFVGSALAGFALFRPQRGGWFRWLFVNFAPASVAFALSFLLILWVFAYFSAGASSERVLTVVYTYQGVGFIIGAIIGFWRNRKARSQWVVEAHNERFLAEIGLRDVGGKTNTWLDAENRELILLDRRQDAVIFRIKEKRGGRSKIELDDEGRMVRYERG